MTIDIGRLWIEDFVGDVLRPRSRVGVRGDDAWFCAQGDIGRGRSKEALTVGAESSASNSRTAEGGRRGVGTALWDFGGARRPSNFARREETGLIEASSDSAEFWAIL